MSQPGPFGPPPTSPNPFQSPQIAPHVPHPAAPAFKPIDHIQYLRMYQYIFENPNWVMNVLLAALCGLIPVVGPLVLLGYQYEIVLAMLTSGGVRYPDFDFNRFADYLQRGLWPFLVQLVASVVIAPLMLVFIIPMFVLMGAAAGAGEDAAPFVFLIGIPLLMIILIPISILPALVLLPMQMRAGLAQDFAEGFNFGWVMDFVKKTWLEMFLGLLFLSFTALILAILGVLACYVGLFVVMPLIFLAQAHLLYELYLLYLSRGGTPIPLKP